jgi:hypothetical protein
MCLLVIWTSAFEKALFSSFARVFIESLILGGGCFLELPLYSYYQPTFCQIHIVGKDFLPCCGWPLQFREYLLCCAEAF